MGRRRTGGPSGSPAGVPLPASSTDVRDVLVRVALGIRDVVAERARIGRALGELPAPRVVHEELGPRLEVGQLDAPRGLHLTDDRLPAALVSHAATLQPQVDAALALEERPGLLQRARRPRLELLPG